MPVESGVAGDLIWNEMKGGQKELVKSALTPWYTGVCSISFPWKSGFGEKCHVACKRRSCHVGAAVPILYTQPRRVLCGEERHAYKQNAGKTSSGAWNEERQRKRAGSTARKAKDRSVRKGAKKKAPVHRKFKKIFQKRCYNAVTNRRRLRLIL